MTKELWSVKPFISHDGPDAKGFRAEVKVGKGCGKIERIEKSESGKAYNVVFDNGHPRYKSSGWVPDGDPVLALVREVDTEENGDKLLEFRIEAKRKPKVDRTRPFEELDPPTETGKALVAVRRPGDNEWVISSTAITRMDEDPARPGSVSANDFTLEELRKLNGGNEASVKPSNSNSVEAAPYMLLNFDGSYNPGSMAVAVPHNIYAFLTDYFKEREVEVTREQMFKVVDLVLDICNRAQVRIYEEEDHERKLEKPDLTLGSHTRARALVFDSLKNMLPLTEEILEDPKATIKWADDTYNKIVAMWLWSIKTVKKLA